MAKQLNAKTTVASGAKWGMKADVRSDKYLVECKTTEKDYYSLTAKVWEKIELEAIRDHLRIPLMMIDLEDKYRLVVFRPQDFDMDYMGQMNVSQKSYKITKDLVEDGEHIFQICGKKNTVLCCMHISDFVMNY